MTRRLAWVIVGALLGVTGYRRVRRVACAIRPGGRRGALPGRGPGRHPTRGGWMSGAALFARDVRDGMELYADRHPGLASRTLEGQQARRHARRGFDYAKDGR